MTLLEFNHIPFEEQCEIIAVEGNYLTFRYDKNMKVYLYALENYFIEVCFSPYQHKITSIEAFTNMDLLNPYLEFVNLAELEA